MFRVDTAFLLLGSACLVLGVCLGFYMGLAQDFGLVPVHAHINLVGWASLALFGVVYRLYPELAASRLAQVHFWLSAPSAVLFPLGIYLSITTESHVLALVAATLWLAGAIVFFIAIAGMTFSRSRAAVAMVAAK